MVPTKGGATFFNHAQKSSSQQNSYWLSTRYDTISSSPCLSEKNENSVIFLFFWWRFGENFPAVMSHQSMEKSEWFLFSQTDTVIYSLFSLFQLEKLHIKIIAQIERFWIILQVCDSTIVNMKFIKKSHNVKLIASESLKRTTLSVLSAHSLWCWSWQGRKLVWNTHLSFPSAPDHLVAASLR